MLWSSGTADLQHALPSCKLTVAMEYPPFSIANTLKLHLQSGSIFQPAMLGVLFFNGFVCFAAWSHREGRGILPTPSTSWAQWRMAIRIIFDLPKNKMMLGGTPGFQNKTKKYSNHETNRNVPRCLLSSPFGSCEDFCTSGLDCYCFFPWQKPKKNRLIISPKSIRQSHSQGLTFRAKLIFPKPELLKALGFGLWISLSQKTGGIFWVHFLCETAKHVNQN